MSGPLEQLAEPSETTVEPPVDSVTTRVWTSHSNASANSNSKKSRISNVFGNKKINHEQWPTLVSLLSVKQKRV